MNTLQYHTLMSMILLCWIVLLCYWSHVVAGDEPKFRGNSSIKCIEHERKALLQFKQGIVSDYCGLLSSWGGIEEDCCQWGGIHCNNHTGHVIMLHLQGISNLQVTKDEVETVFCLEGKLDPSLFTLKHLKSLDLSFNNFKQKIPSYIDSLTNLEYLNLSLAGFYGEIPPQLGNLSKLAFLDLTENFHTAKSLKWMSRLTLLREVQLSQNDLSEVGDWVQTINNLPSLRILHLDSCSLRATFPPSSSLSYINSSTSLRVVSLSHNIFNDTTLIFQWLFNLSRNCHQLEYLDLSRCSLLGPIPSSFGRYMHSLSYLDISHNSLSGILPTSLGKYMYSLSYLRLSCNQFVGSIPTSFSNLRALRVLLISHNKLHGPSSINVIGNLCNLQRLDIANNNLDDNVSNIFQALSTGCANKPLLEHLDLSMNQLWGSIPDVIYTFSLIRGLHLSGNNLNGTISERIGQLSMLESFDVSNNSLKATLNRNHFLHQSRLVDLCLSDNSALVVSIDDDDDDWIPPFQLKSILLRSCKLGPSFPNWLLNQSQYSTLDISNAQISSEVPLAFWKKLHSQSPYVLSLLNMSHNNFHGVLPNLSSSLNSYVIDLSSNYFEGPIPLSFLGVESANVVYLNNNMFSDATQLLCRREHASNLQELDLSNNLLSGRLPNCSMKMDYLISLHLENNKFSGNIPTSIGDLQSLQYLHLQNNSFSGELPASMLNCKDMIFLDVGYNSLTGYIPPTIGNAFTRLGFLNLSGNKFIGKLPISLCKLSELHMLDAAFNHISGTIPNCIYNLTAMMNVSHMLDIEAWDMGEFGSSNEETAMIEWKKEKQRFKQNLLGLVNYIDLSNNDLQGNIPTGISNLTKLVSLDLSRNKLTGSIPSNIGQLTSLQFLDLSNNHLSSVIPTSLADVSFLGILDLSNNNLSGRIPLSTQLQGFDPSSYMGNPLLCGAPLLQGCAGDEPPGGGNTIHQEEHGNNDNFFLGLCISVVLGFIIGFWGVCGTLVVKTSWRHAFFSFLDDIKDKVYVMVVVSVVRVWRKP